MTNKKLDITDRESGDDIYFEVDKDDELEIGMESDDNAEYRFLTRHEGHQLLRLLQDWLL
jgi:hypothetical protein